MTKWTKIAFGIGCVCILQSYNCVVRNAWNDTGSLRDDRYGFKYEDRPGLCTGAWCYFLLRGLVFESKEPEK